MALLLFIGVYGLILYYVLSREKRLRKQWTLIAEGEYQKAIHRRTNLVIESGFTRKHKNHLSSLMFSTIFFTDGRTVVVMNIDKFPAPGTYIKIYKNPLPEFKIEIDEMPNSACL